MTDLVQRLRIGTKFDTADKHEAADLIEKLTAERDRQTNCIRAMTEQIAALIQEKEELKRKAEMDYAIMAGDNALIAGLKTERDMLVDALKEIASQDTVELMLDPQWARRIAKAAVEKTK